MDGISESGLKNGGSYRFVDQYETIKTKVSYAKTLDGVHAFKIWINGKPVFISKTFKPTIQKLNDLIDKHKLKELKFK